jgi:hypothetical protein
MLFEHYSQIPEKIWRWPNFGFKSDKFLACPHCGEFYLDFYSLDSLQRTRYILNAPISINSGHRCWIHNYKVGGAINSEHKNIAFDLKITRKIDRFDLLLAARMGGFRSFGFYVSFLHVDKRLNRVWYSSNKAKELWNGQRFLEVWRQPVVVESLESLAA